MFGSHPATHTAPPPVARGKRGGIVAASKYTSVPQVLVRRFNEAKQSWDDILRKGWQDGGFLSKALAMEKALIEERLRLVGKQMQDYQQNNKSEHKLVAALPAREYMRLKRVDPHFFEDDKNLRRYKSDNPNAHVTL